MRKLIFTISSLLFTLTLSAQQTTNDSGWTKQGNTGINMSQASFSNWQAGGDPSIAFDTYLNYSLDYKKDKTLWTNRIELAYGLNKTKSNGTRKTNDKIYLASNYGYKMVENLYLGAMLTFQTQFDKGYDYSKPEQSYLSKFMAPGYLNIGIGAIWTPRNWLKVTFAPASWRGTFVFDDTLPEGKRYGVEVGKNLLNQFGANLVAEVNIPIWDNVTYYSRLDLYSNYLRKPQNIIVKWDNQLNMKINRWLSAGLNVNMIYDENASTDFQFKQTLGVGLQVNF